MKIATLLSTGSLLALGAAGALGVMTLADASSDAGPTAAPAAGYVPAGYVQASAQSSAQTYTVDGVHSGVIFRIMHAGAAPFYGMFTDLSGDMTIDSANPAASRLNMSIDTSKVATGNNNRDDHLRSADFFNARQFPTATFTSTSVKAAENGAMEVTGDLTLLGVTKPVTATMTPTGEGQFRGSTRAGFETTLTFNRSDFGMTAYIDQGTLGDEVRLTVFIEGIEQ